jgi:transglycosylase-like protein
MPGRRGPFCTLIVAALAVLGAAAPAWSGCPAGLPAEPAFHLPVDKLIPVASRLADHIAKKTIQSGAANGVETRRLADVRLDPKVNYNFRVYTPLSAIPARVQNALVAAGELPTRAEIESVKRRQLDCLETEVHRSMSEWLKLVSEAEKGKTLPEGPAVLVPGSVLRTMRWFAHEFLSPEDRDAILKRDIRRRGNEEIIGYLIIKSDKVTVDQVVELSLNIPYFGRASYGITAASMNYFGKPADRLSVAEAAYLAVLPRGPNNYHPVRKAVQAVERRNWVIDQMQAKGFVGEADAKSAKAEPLNVTVK